MKLKGAIIVTAATLLLLAGVVLIAQAQSSFPVQLDRPPENITAAANAPGVESFRLPPFVVKDVGGPIGQAIYYDASGPTILFNDGGRRFPVTVGGPNRLFTRTTIGYTDSDCGTTDPQEYLEQPSSAGGWWGLLEHTYGIRGTGSSTEIFRVTQADSGAGVTIQSRWSNLTDTCISNGFPNPIEATKVSHSLNFPLSLE